jgi:DNA-binding NarL/FixJ family response regulator
MHVHALWRPPREHTLTPSMESEPVIHIAVVEDDRSTREGLRLLLDGTPGFRCVTTCRSAEEALASPHIARADVLLLDIHLPGLPGTEAVALFRERHPKLLILMLTVYAEEEKIFQSLCAGANGYLLKKTPPARLLESIREAYAGGAAMSPEIADKVIRLFRELRPPAPFPHDLSPHEIRLLSLLAEGYSYQAAGDRLHISINTVRGYIRAIYEKLHVHTKSEAVSKALRGRII